MKKILILFIASFIIALGSAILITGMIFIWDNPMKDQRYSITTPYGGEYGTRSKTYYCKEYITDSKGVHFYDNATKDSVIINGDITIQKINHR
jgi:hypothetical protein